MNNLPADYDALVAFAVDSEPAHTVWRPADVTPLTLEQIDLVRTARPSEFDDEFADVIAEKVIAADLRADLDKPPLVLQARMLAVLEWTARIVLFNDAVDEAGRREYDATFGEADERGEQAYQRAKGETL